jgi:PilZ domain
MESHISEIFGGNRRRVLRRKARLLVSISFIEEDATAGSAHGPSSVLGYTRDLSAEGLALIVPSIPPGEDALTSGAQQLRIILALPTEDIEMLVTVVRHERLDERDTEIGYLVGVSISETSEHERDIYLEYLRTLGV